MIVKAMLVVASVSAIDLSSTRDAHSSSMQPAAEAWNTPTSPASVPGANPDNNGNLTFAEGTLLPSVQCLEYMALKNSSQLPLFKAQMQALGMWDRVTVHIAAPDPEGKPAGCFRAHVAAWNHALSRGCESALMLEEDVFFNEPVVEKSMINADAFVASGLPFDMLFLGYACAARAQTSLLTTTPSPKLKPEAEPLNYPVLSSQSQPASQLVSRTPSMSHVLHHKPPNAAGVTPPALSTRLTTASGFLQAAAKHHRRCAYARSEGRTDAGICQRGRRLSRRLLLRAPRLAEHTGRRRHG